MKDVIVNGRLITREDFVLKVGTYPKVHWDYSLIANALSWHTLPKETQNNFYFREFEVCKWERRRIYNAIKPTSAPHADGMWQRKYGTCVDMSQAWRIVSQQKETRLAALAWKIFHNIYPTSILLNRMGIRDTSACLECGDRDYIEHFFYACKLVKPLWGEVEREIQTFLIPSFRIDEKMAVLGVTKQDASGSTSKAIQKANKAILIAKLAISKFRYGKSSNLVQTYTLETMYRTNCHGKGSLDAIPYSTE